MRLVLDPAVRVRGRTLVGAGRVIRLSERGPEALAALAQGDPTPAQRRLGERLVDAGLAHPEPDPAPADVTVVIPVRDRPAQLTRCLAALTQPVIVVDDGSREPVAAAAPRVLVLRRERAGGPGDARNAALPHVTTALVAFLDSDCLPPPGWIEALAGHFADPRVAAVAPRVRALHGGRSPLDMGPHPGAAGPANRVRYVPSAALIVRTELAAFDAGLRYGEDVDLVWRLHDAGWRVRYDPRVVVLHDEPKRTLARRFRYGTSAAPLAKRHPGRLAPAILRPWPTLAVALLLARRPLPAAAAVFAPAIPLARRGVPARLAPLIALQGALATWQAVGRALAQFAPLSRAFPVRLEDLAYGAGVYAGCLRERTLAPLAIRPRIGGSPTI